MLRALASAVLFLTRIPLPRLALDERDFARSAGYFAWVGLVIAGFAWAVAWASAPLGPRIAALLATVAWIAITGGMHLDGLADTVDGLSGGRGDARRTLEIMRDSRIGAHGAVALVLAIAAKWALLEPLLGAGRPSWLVAPVAARFACTLLMAWLPYARREGLGSAFVGAVRLPSLALGLAALLATGISLGGAAVLAGAAGVLAALALAARAGRLLGGLTGDLYGAAIELAELVSLLVLAGCALR